MLNVNFIRLKDSCIEKRIYYQPKYTNSWVVCEIKKKQWLWVEVNSYWWYSWCYGPVIADIPEIVNQGNIYVLNNLLSKIVICKGNTAYPIILERCIEIKEPFPGLSKERLALLVQSSLGYY